MNKKAQVSLMAFMVAIVVILLGLAFMGPLNLVTTDAMNDSNSIGEVGGMNCTSTFISDFTKAGCYAVDLNQLLFLGGIIAIAGIIISAKIIFG